MNPSEEWLQKWEEKKDLFLCPTNLEEYFTKDEILGIKIRKLSMGDVSIPTGELLVRDPLCFLNRNEKPYLKKIPTSTFPVTTCVILPEDDCARYAAVKLSLNSDIAVRFEEALIGNENITDFEEGEFFGFNVDAGLACFIDSKVRDAFCDFKEDFQKKNPESNFYDDYFAKLFKESYEKYPEYQRPDGDWINWNIPGTEYTLPIFQSGFGDGAYPVYFGYDQQGELCSVFIQFIDIELAYGEEEEED